MLARRCELLDAGRAFDLLLTDVVMPEGMTGLDLAKAVRSRLPDLPILLPSGYNDVVASNGAEFPVLRKPVPYEELRRVISVCLDRAAKLRDEKAGALPVRPRAGWRGRWLERFRAFAPIDGGTIHVNARHQRTRCG